MNLCVVMCQGFTLFIAFCVLSNVYEALKCRMDGGLWTPDSRNQYNLRDAYSGDKISSIIPLLPFISLLVLECVIEFGPNPKYRFDM